MSSTMSGQGRQARGGCGGGRIRGGIRRCRGKLRGGPSQGRLALLDGRLLAIVVGSLPAGPCTFSLAISLSVFLHGPSPQDGPGRLIPNSLWPLAPPLMFLLMGPKENLPRDRLRPLLPAAAALGCGS